MNLLINVCVLTAPSTSHSPVPLPFLGPPYSLRHKNIEVRPINNPKMASKRSSERKSHTLNQKPEMIKLSEEGMLKSRSLVPNS